MKTALLATLVLCSITAQAEPAVIYDMGGKFDKSFNEAAYRGAERWKQETGKTYLDFEIANEAQREQAMRRMAEKGANPIIGVGFGQGSTMEKVARDYPKLQFATIEAGAGWVPYTLHAMDFGYEAHNFWVMPKLKYKPSEYFHMHGHASFETDPIGVELRDRMGVDTLLWGNDYPHIEGCWPHSEEQIGSWGKGLTRDEIAKIIGLNSAKLFHIDVPEQYRIS